MLSRHSTTSHSISSRFQQIVILSPPKLAPPPYSLLLLPFFFYMNYPISVNTNPVSNGSVDSSIPYAVPSSVGSSIPLQPMGVEVLKPLNPVSVSSYQEPLYGVRSDVVPVLNNVNDMVPNGVSGVGVSGVVSGVSGGVGVSGVNTTVEMSNMNGVSGVVNDPSECYMELLMYRECMGSIQCVFERESVLRDESGW